MLYRIWSLLKEAYHYEKHLIMFALIVMGLLRSRPWWSCWKAER